MGRVKRTRPSSSRQRIFTAFALAIPFVLLVAVELTLRLAAYGSDAPLFVPFEPAPGYLRTNDRVAERYFVSDATLPTIPLEIFSSEKKEGEVRIVVQGGSSAAGFPYYFGAGLADQLESCLRDLLPDRPVEVIGTAMAAVNSFTLLDLADEIVALEPDAVVIYAGHNEFYGALGVSSSQSLGRSPGLKRLLLKLRRFRIVQALRDVLSAAATATGGAATGSPPGITMMERMVGDQSVAYGSDSYTAGIEQFRSNLRLLVDRYAQAGIPVILGTLASNVRDQPPFVDGASNSNDLDELLRAVSDAEDLIPHDTAAAIRGLRAVVALDTVFAGARFSLGRLLLSTGERAEARALLYEAKDRDQLRFRAPEVLNDVVRETQTLRPNVYVADVQSVLEAAARDGIVDSTLMTEHLHPNLRGYRLLTGTYLQSLAAAGVVELGEETARSCRPNVTRLDSLVGHFRLIRLKGSWPFKPAGSAALELLSAKGRDFEESRALSVFREEMDRTETLEELRKHYVDEKRFEDARIAALAIAQRFPFLAKPLADAGDAAVAQGRYDEAFTYYARSLELEESGAAHRMSGTILLQRGRPDDREDAIHHLRRALELEPGHPQTLYNLAGALALRGDFEQARATCEELLARYPGHEAGRKLLESLPG